jgi:hypothetical protein
MVPVPVGQSTIFLILKVDNNFPILNKLSPQGT